ncbi:conjugative transposon protein TraN [Mucilaginibacter sp. dw_454]|uniref:conjugative transposon protein TraN n=1 Tax=Mucilaginibacter sp. dw_454 TaxID=2720079 RepID=UPI001BD3FA0F|nr:conjugative transposon protein TraN [Mucilaginibacter sp. dw_454]
MKYLLIIAALCASLSATAQQTDSISSKAVLPSYHLDITTHKTTLLIFPAAIQSADRGDKYVLAEKVKGVDNALKVKAGQKGFEPSNLHVITAEGNVYDFNVSYADQPAYQTVDLRKQPPFAAATFDGVSLNSRQLEDYAGIVTGSYPFLNGVHYRKHGMDFRLDGIYIKDDVLFFSYKVKNTTAIRYDTGSLRFYIRDKDKAKRTAEQDKEISPLYVQHTGTAENDKGETIVAAFAKFTIAENKNFVTELMEQGGDRNPTCKLDQDKLLQAKTLVH